MGSRKQDNVDRIQEIYDEELWRAHEMCRSRLIATCRDRMVKQYGRRNAPAATMKDVATVLDQDALTIGFARRFATYKRATLVLNDPERLEAILTSKRQPVQMIIAGKAHPRDDEGKEYIRKIVEFTRRPAVKHKIIFLEDYDMSLARAMVQGADVWLNTPRRPFEASGTSGMKAAVNGGLNVSILDGWWAEACSEDVGWCIGTDSDANGDDSYQDKVDANALYNLLENDVIPTFYERKNGSVPSRWIQMMKASMQMAVGRFCSYRMVGEYHRRFYLTAARRADTLMADGCREAAKLAHQDDRFRKYFNDIRIDPPTRGGGGFFRVGDAFNIESTVYLGELKPGEVDVQVYYGRLQSEDMVDASHIIPMEVAENHENGEYLYTCTLQCDQAGRHGYTVRITPRGDGYIKNKPGMIAWA